jgi:hypothetical protein
MTVDTLGGAPVVLAGAVTITLAGLGLLLMRLRTTLRPRVSERRAAGPGPLADSGVVPRVLEARGLATAAQIRRMTPREREFLLEQGSAVLGPGGLVRAAGPRAAPAAAAPPVEDVYLEPQPLVVHCPGCTASFGDRGDAPCFVAPCPGCRRRVSAHMDGQRLVVTVDVAATGDGPGRPTPTRRRL